MDTHTNCASTRTNADYINLRALHETANASHEHTTEDGETAGSTQRFTEDILENVSVARIPS